jgi:hypothetical protein
LQNPKNRQKQRRSEQYGTKKRELLGFITGLNAAEWLNASQMIGAWEKFIRFLAEHLNVNIASKLKESGWTLTIS